MVSLHIFQRWPLKLFNKYRDRFSPPPTGQALRQDAVSTVPSPDRPLGDEVISSPTTSNGASSLISQLDTPDALRSTLLGGPDGRGLQNSEKMANKVTDTTGRVMQKADSYPLREVRDAVACGGAQLVAKDILEDVLDGVPALMNALETLSKVHPFIAIAFLPFKLIYHQECQRRDNDKKRIALFLKIKEVMMALADLRDAAPQSNEILTNRLKPLCQKMEIDIQECFNVLSAQERCSISIKFLKASSWNKVLAEYATRFVETREKVSYALGLNTYQIVAQTSENLTKMIQLLSDSSLMSLKEQRMGRWFDLYEGEEVVLNSDEKCAELIKFEASLTVGRPTSVVGWLSRERTRKGAVLDNEDDEKAIGKAVADLRKEYRKDIHDSIRENLESYSKRFEMGLEDLRKELGVIGEKIKHQGDRVIKYLEDGRRREPSNQIQDAIIYHIWKNQGWKGSAKTQPLVLAVRDYFVERTECSKITTLVENKQEPKRLSVAAIPINSTAANRNISDQVDPEADINNPLPDSWIIECLHPKRLRYVQHVFDPDFSGFTTISEINNFTAARPDSWSTPRWISYFAMGWQIFATKYCIEIEEIFAQMSLLGHEIGNRMPGNKTYVNEYIDATWQHVTALTSSVERYEAPAPWLPKKFASHVESHEQTLKERLEKVRYSIDAVETVNLILDHDRIEYSIFTLIALLMRRHLAKIHLCLKQEIDSRELRDDSLTVTFVVDAAWQRFLELKDRIEHSDVGDSKQIFGLLACGLFKNYWDWDSWLNPRYFMACDVTALSSVNTIRDLDNLDPNILVYSGTAISLTEPPSISEAPTSEVGLSITGTWYGFHRTEFQNPCTSMSRMHIRCADSGELTGDGDLFGDHTWTLTGTRGSKPVMQHRFLLKFYCVNGDYSTKINYTGILYQDKDILAGSFSSQSIGRSEVKGSFLFRKNSDGGSNDFKADNIMCLRPTEVKLNPKKLWSFACLAVLDSIRRRKRRCLLERMPKIRRALQLTQKQKLDLLTLNEKSEHSQIYKSFSFNEFAEIYRLYSWYERFADLHMGRQDCDGCGAGISGSRVVCLDCTSTDAVPNTVDFCSKSDCIAVASLPGRADVSHHPWHVMIKTRDFLLLKDYFAVKTRAHYATDNARKACRASPLPNRTVPRIPAPRPVTVSTPVVTTLTPVYPSLVLMARQPSGQSIIDFDSEAEPAAEPRRRACSAPTEVLPVDEDRGKDRAVECLICKHIVSTPCWYCADCRSEGGSKFICDACEMQLDEMAPSDFAKRHRTQVNSHSGAHNMFHLLVRLNTFEATKPGGDNYTVDNREAGIIRELGERIHDLTKRLEAVERCFGEETVKLKTGLERIEHLLTAQHL